MNVNHLDNILSLMDSLQSAVIADELLRKVYLELEEKNLEIDPRLQNELNLYFGFDDSE